MAKQLLWSHFCRKKKHCFRVPDHINFSATTASNDNVWLLKSIWLFICAILWSHRLYMHCKTRNIQSINIDGKYYKRFDMATRHMRKKKRQTGIRRVIEGETHMVTIEHECMQRPYALTYRYNARTDSHTHIHLIKFFGENSTFLRLFGFSSILHIVVQIANCNIYCAAAKLWACVYVHVQIGVSGRVYTRTNGRMCRVWVIVLFLKPSWIISNVFNQKTYNLIHFFQVRISNRHFYMSDF